MFGIKAFLTCRAIRRKLVRYIDGELDVTMIAEVDRHLKDCERCRGEYGRFRQVMALVQKYHSPVPR